MSQGSDARWTADTVLMTVLWCAGAAAVLGALFGYLAGRYAALTSLQDELAYQLEWEARQETAHAPIAPMVGMDDTPVATPDRPQQQPVTGKRGSVRAAVPTKVPVVITVSEGTHMAYSPVREYEEVEMTIGPSTGKKASPPVIPGLASGLKVRRARRGCATSTDRTQAPRLDSRPKPTCCS